MSDLVGHDIGRYHIVEQLGQGGMAVVYKAFDTRLERDVAIKVIRMSSFAPDLVQQMLKRFEREARSLARLDHPNIIPIYDYGEHDGSPYLVMKFVSGGTLKAQANKQMPYQQAARLLAPIARALEYAHGKDVIHRDVKPANILITENGHPMLSDFGVAKILEGGEGNTLTGTGVGIGTPEYMAPEQWENQVTPQTDIYALGVVFYELITGRRPYSADTPAAIYRKVLMDPLPRPKVFVPDLPEAVERALFKALAKTFEDRYGSMAEFADILEELTLPVKGQLIPPVASVKDDSTLIAPPIDPALQSDFRSAPAQWPPQVSLDRSRKERPVESQPAASLKIQDSALRNPMLNESTLMVPPPEKQAGEGFQWKKVIIGGVILLGLAGLGVKGQLDRPLIDTPTGAPTHEPIPTSTLTSSPTREPVPTLTLTSPPTRKPIPTLTLTNPPAPHVRTISTQVSPKDGMVMVYVPEGQFQMGSKDGKEDEKPVHRVWLDAYWIDQTDVTFAMYAKCVVEGICTESMFKDDANYNGSQQPVVGVDWNDASTYCAWAGRSLPSEAQWEKAARGTDGRTYPWGNQTPGPNLLNSNGSEDGYQYTSPVGHYPDGASPYGALDMAGNVWQWVADLYDSAYYANSPDKNPTGATSIFESVRVLRGGSWGNYVYLTRSAYRYNFNPANRNYIIGFRCAVSTVP